MVKYLSLLRVKHYIKNLYVFLPAFFSGQFLHIIVLENTFKAFFAFCFAASTIYIINDIADRELDRQHHQKKKRAIASGAVSVRFAYAVAAIVFILSMFLALLVSVKLVVLVFLYVLLNIFYTFWLKSIAIVDVSIISIGFVMRVLAGGLAGGIFVSKWLIIMVFLLSMFQALAKRTDDLYLIQSSTEGVTLRKSLNGYSVEFLQILSSVLSGIMIVCYIMYITQPEIVLRLGENSYFTAFFVLVGLMRYLQITFVHKASGSPVNILFKDRFIQLCILCWFVSFFVLIYIK